ncbi:unnamed protein product [Dicrocoelium dendriticum]|nr:unnamed protein product [Dicrocoelium dendriticum]
MGKLARLVICGPSGAGKTSLIEHCIHGNFFSKSAEDFVPTIEDTYNAVVETDRGTRERMRIYDLGGKSKIERHFINNADAFILVYDVTDARTLTAVKLLKRQLDECRGKREAMFVLCGNKVDRPRDPSIDTAELNKWAQSERRKSGFSFGKKDTRCYIGVGGPSRPDAD